MLTQRKQLKFDFALRMYLLAGNAGISDDGDYTL
jgi:hypothetical protein